MLNGSEVLFPSARDELFIVDSVSPICLPQAGLPSSSSAWLWTDGKGDWPALFRGDVALRAPEGMRSSTPANMANPLPWHFALSLL